MKVKMKHDCPDGWYRKGELAVVIREDAGRYAYCDKTEGRSWSNPLRQDFYWEVEFPPLPLANGTGVVRRHFFFSYDMDRMFF